MGAWIKNVTYNQPYCLEYGKAHSWIKVDI